MLITQRVKIMPVRGPNYSINYCWQSDFNHRPASLWNYLGIDNLNSLQTECAFKCVDEGLKCTSECGDFDKKCNYTCAREGLNCVRECMELRPTVAMVEEEPEEEEEAVEEEIKADRLARKKCLSLLTIYHIDNMPRLWLPGEIVSA